jgi:flagellar basal body-associated protein FliL
LQLGVTIVKLPIPHGRRAILALGLPLGLAAAGALVFTQMSAAPKVTPKVPDPAPGQAGLMLVLDNRVINLTGTAAGGYKYAKLGVTIELRPAAASFYDLHGTERTKEEKTELDKRAENTPLLLDALGSVVAAHDSSSLDTDGRAKLKDELLTAFRKILGQDDVIRVYFTDFVMQ